MHVEMPVRAASLVSRCTFPSGGSQVTCAVSGGADSLALLVLAVTAGCEVSAIHVDHGVREGSAQEADVVRAAAARFGASFRAVQVKVEPGPNLEARLRAARYSVLPAGSLTGHTADDQAETVLLNLVRGSGISGLAGMRRDRHPILSLRRWETAALCETLGLQPVVDPSNHSPAHRRNRIRHEVLPLLDDVAGRDVSVLLTRLAELARGEDEWLECAASVIDPTDAVALAAAPLPLARRAVRAWLTSSLGGYPPRLDDVDRVLSVARGDRVACELAGGIHVRRSHQRLAARTLRDAPQR